MTARRDARKFECGDEAFLEAFRTGELPRKEKRTVESHLESCTSCRAIIADLESGDAIAALLREARAEIPESLRRQLIETTTTALGGRKS